MARARKEPALLRKNGKDEYFVSRDWVGWYVLYKLTEKFDLETMLVKIESMAPGFIGKEGEVTASVSRDACAVVTFTPVV